MTTSKRTVNSPYFQFLNEVFLLAIMADSYKWCLDNVEYKFVLKGIRHNRMQSYFILKIFNNKKYIVVVHMRSTVIKYLSGNGDIWRKRRRSDSVL